MGHSVWLATRQFCYRIHTQTRQEIVDSYHCRMSFDTPAPPVRTGVDTDASNPIALKYKEKTNEWTKNDFDNVYNMQVSYFGTPLGLAGLAMAFKIGIATDWLSQMGMAQDPRSILVHKQYACMISTVATVLFVSLFILYAARLILSPKKCFKEWDCPLHSNSFGIIPIAFLIFSFLLYNEIDYDPNNYDEERPQIGARILFWIVALGHCFLTVAKVGEWIGRRLELDHVQPHWMIFSLGLAAASMVATIVQPFGVFDIRTQKEISLLWFLCMDYVDYALCLILLLGGDHSQQ